METLIKFPIIHSQPTRGGCTISEAAAVAVVAGRGGVGLGGGGLVCRRCGDKHTPGTPLALLIATHEPLKTLTPSPHLSHTPAPCRPVIQVLAAPRPRGSPTRAVHLTLILSNRGGRLSMQGRPRMIHDANCRSVAVHADPPVIALLLLFFLLLLLLLLLLLIFLSPLPPLSHFLCLIFFFMRP
ncbi:hypothetical protein E2C01_062991 [Portunus trituberculatus]|uniref:Uncharacterized protein n=1 Tax=Portunus trituberculatus TaxID=210409 RepID=A0A5B7H813_PORTR|nr:hypothetical protein [Portunus trituberculatus]